MQSNATRDFVIQRRRFIDQINAPTPFEIVIRGHIWAEAELIGLLKDALPVPQAINLVRFTFPQEVQMACAMGLVAQEFSPPLLKLNSLRNLIAHNVDAEITESHQAELFNAFDVNNRPNPIYLKELSFPDPLRVTIATLVSIIYVGRVRLAARGNLVERVDNIINTLEELQRLAADIHQR